MALCNYISRQDDSRLCHFNIATPMSSLPNVTKGVCSFRECDKLVSSYVEEVKKHDAHIVETLTFIQNVPVLVDFDLSIMVPKTTVPFALYNDNDVCEVATAYARALRDLFHTLHKEYIEFALLTKPPRKIQKSTPNANNEEDGNSSLVRMKHGFHLQSLNVTVPKSSLSALFASMGQHMTIQGYPTQHNDSKRKLNCFKPGGSCEKFALCLGEGDLTILSHLDRVTEHNKGWLMYGSTKSKDETNYFKVDKVVRVNLADDVVTMVNWTEAGYSENLSDIVKLLSLNLPSNDKHNAHALNEIIKCISTNDAPFSAASVMSSLMNDYQTNVIDEDISLPCTTFQNQAENSSDEDNIEVVACNEADKQSVYLAVETALCALEDWLPEYCTDYMKWREVMVAMINLVKSNHLSEQTAYQLFVNFSKLADRRHKSDGRTRPYYDSNVESIWNNEINKKNFKLVPKAFFFLISKLSRAILSGCSTSGKSVNAINIKRLRNEIYPPIQSMIVDDTPKPSSGRKRSTVAIDDTHKRPKIDNYRKRTRPLISSDEEDDDDDDVNDAGPSKRCAIDTATTTALNNVPHYNPYSHNRSSSCLSNRMIHIYDQIVENGTLKYKAPRQQKAKDVTHLTLYMIDINTYNNPKCFKWIVQGLLSENYFCKRFSRSDIVYMLFDTLQYKKYAGVTDLASVERIVNDQYDEMTDGDLVQVHVGRAHTMGRVFAMAKLNSPEYAAFIDAIVCQLFSTSLTENDMATSVLYWMPKPIGYLDNSWYEYCNNAYNNVYEMEAGLMTRIRLWVRERVHFEKFMEHGFAYVEKYDNMIAPTEVQLENGKKYMPPKSDLFRVHEYVNSSDSCRKIIKCIAVNCTIGGGNYKRVLFDDNPNLFAFNNCVYDATILCVRPGVITDHISRSIKFDFISKEDLDPDVVSFINKFWEDIHPIPEKRKFFLDSIANIFDPQNPWKQYQFWTGEGENGKSVCVNWFETILDDLCSKLSLSLLLCPGKNGASDGPTPSVVALHGTCLAFTDEISPNEILDSGRLKKYSGNDKLVGRDLFRNTKERIKFKPRIIPVAVANKMPNIKCPDLATHQRLAEFRFDTRFVDDIEQTYRDIDNGLITDVKKEYVKKKDENMDKRLEDEKVNSTFISMLLHRHIENKIKIMSGDFTVKIPPDCVKQTVTAYKLSKNIVRLALADKYEFSDFELLSDETLESMSKDEVDAYNVRLHEANEQYSDKATVLDIIREIKEKFPYEKPDKKFVVQEMRKLVAMSNSLVRIDDKILDSHGCPTQVLMGIKFIE